MPSLFDNHTEFNEWFSRDIESHAENKSQMDDSKQFIFLSSVSCANVDLFRCRAPQSLAYDPEAFHDETY